MTLIEAQQGAPATISLDNIMLVQGRVLALGGLSLRIPAGITGVLGPNGSGKTSLFRVLAGLVRPKAGQAHVLGADPYTDARTRGKIVLVPAVDFFDEKVSARKNIRLALMARGFKGSELLKRTEHALDTTELDDRANEAYGTWSRGMRQRLKLAYALATQADIYLLDEPLQGVDPPTRVAIRELIQTLGDQGRTVLIASHILHDVEQITDQVLLLANGRLLGHGRLGELLDRLRDQHPHRIRLFTDEPRKLAEALIGLKFVREVSLVSTKTVEFVTNRPKEAYAELPQLIRRQNALVWRVETKDNDLEALFDYMVG